MLPPVGLAWQVRLQDDGFGLEPLQPGQVCCGGAGARCERGRGARPASPTHPPHPLTCPSGHGGALCPHAHDGQPDGCARWGRGARPHCHPCQVRQGEPPLGERQCMAGTVPVRGEAPLQLHAPPTPRRRPPCRPSTAGVPSCPASSCGAARRRRVCMRGRLQLRLWVSMCRHAHVLHAPTCPHPLPGSQVLNEVNHSDRVRWLCCVVPPAGRHILSYKHTHGCGPAPSRNLPYPGAHPIPHPMRHRCATRGWTPPSPPRCWRAWPRGPTKFMCWWVRAGAGAGAGQGRS